MEPMLICSSSGFLPSHPTTITAKLPFTTLHPMIKNLFHKQTAQTSDNILINNLSSKPPTSIQSGSVDNKTVNNNNKNPLNNIFNTLDDLISTFLDLPLHSNNDPKQVLLDNFEPVGEYPPTSCPVVVGSLPSCLEGAYIRNGPNPRFIPNGPYHLFDGDGMIHMVKISKGEATFCCRYVKTHKYETEAVFGHAVVPNLISCFNGPAASAARALVIAARVLIARQFDPARHGFGVANTAVALLSGRIFAVCESDLPYEIKITENGDIETLGRYDFQTTEPSSFVRMTAHPRVDLETGDAFAFRYGPTCPFLTFHRIDRHGRKGKDVPIFSKKECTVVHDFGLTEKHAIFPDMQLVIDPMRVLRGEDSAVGVDAGKIPRVGIIPRYAEDGGEMRWIETPGFNMIHVANAWEGDGGDTIVMVATNSLKMEHFMRNMECSALTLEMVTIDVKAKSVKRRPLSSAGRCHELATINLGYANKKNRYVYAAVMDGRAFVGVEKLDLSVAGGDGDCTVARRMYGPGSYSGESVFVAKDPAAEEDDGYLITYVHDKNTQESKFLVMDAKSPNLDIIAAVRLPQRIPNGFHGLFVPESDLF